MSEQTSKLIALAALTGLIVSLIGCASVRATDTQTPTQSVPTPNTAPGANYCSPSDQPWYWYSRVRIPDYGKPGFPVFAGMNYATVILTNKLTGNSKVWPSIQYKLLYFDMNATSWACANSCPGAIGLTNVCFTGVSYHTNLYMVYFYNPAPSPGPNPGSAPNKWTDVYLTFHQ